MRDRNTFGGMVEDTPMNPNASFDNAARPDHRIDPNGPADPSNWEDIEDANILLNPDFDSMESRG